MQVSWRLRILQFKNMLASITSL